MNFNVLDNPTPRIFEKWNNAIKDIVGEGNFSFGATDTIATLPFAVFIPLEGQPLEYVLEGDESQVEINIQIDSYAKSTSKAYEIDSFNKQFFARLGFTCTGQADFTRLTNSNIARVTSRFALRYNGKLFEE
jgi:hypothetical protein